MPSDQVISRPVLGWNNKGHMMVAGVAYRLLNDQVKNRVEMLLQLNPDRTWKVNCLRSQNTHHSTIHTSGPLSQRILLPEASEGLEA
jgi:hypothetical protein